MMMIPKSPRADFTKIEEEDFPMQTQEQGSFDFFRNIKKMEGYYSAKKQLD
jgi:hypothetical protein